MAEEARPPLGRGLLDSINAFTNETWTAYLTPK